MIKHLKQISILRENGDKSCPNYASFSHWYENNDVVVILFD